MRPQNEIAKGTNRHIPRCDLYLALMVDQSGGETVKFYTDPTNVSRLIPQKRAGCIKLVHKNRSKSGNFLTSPIERNDTRISDCHAGRGDAKSRLAEPQRVKLGSVR